MRLPPKPSLEVVYPNQNFEDSSPRMINAMLNIQRDGNERFDVGSSQGGMELGRVKHVAAEEDEEKEKWVERLGKRRSKP